MTLTLKFLSRNETNDSEPNGKQEFLAFNLLFNFYTNVTVVRYCY
jgi:hypothetical protein